MTTSPSSQTVTSVYPLLDNAKAAIFDNDGTLVNSMPVHHQLWQQALSFHGLQFPESQFYAYAGMPAIDIIRILSEEQKHQSLSDTTINEILRTRERIMSQGDPLSSVKAVRVSAELLQYARDKGLKVAVASGGQRVDVLVSLKAAGFDVNDFDALITAEDVQNGKPHPETFLTAAHRLEVDPHTCVGFEDGEKGLQALKAAGMVPVDVRWIDGYPLPECMKK